jgi:hypothetical protein
MHRFPKLLWACAVVCASCTPAESHRPAVAEQSIAAKTAIVAFDSSANARANSTDLVATDSPDSIPLNGLRDSLSVEGNPEPKVPMVFAEVCPGEGCSYGTWIACQSIAVTTAQRPGAPVAFTLHRGDSLSALTGDQVVEQAGKIVFRDTVRVAAMVDRYLFTPADTLYPLSYDGEGEGTWFFHGRVGGGEWFFSEFGGPQNNPAIVLVRPRITRWWVRARSQSGKEGWFEYQPGIAFNPQSHYANGCPNQ